MFKSPNDMYFESRQGQGAFIFKGRIKGERVEATSLSAPELDTIANQIEEIRSRIRTLTIQQPSPLTTTNTSVPTPAIDATSSVSDVDILTQIHEMRDQIRSADLPGILSQMDEIRASVRAIPPATTPAVASVPQVSIQQLSKLQDQVTRLVGQMNTLQDRVSILEGRMRLEASSSSVSARPVMETISDVASAAAGAAASAVVNRAAMKLEDMVSPGALYNLRKVSERGPIKYAW